MKSLFILIITISILFSNPIKVAVAANVSYAIDDLIKAFNKKYPNLIVQTTIGSSGKLTAQIKNGAPYSILISANMAYPNALFKDGLAITKPKIYAKGSLALLTTKNLNLNEKINTLLNPKIDKIAIANDKTAPYGVATKEALENAKIYSKLKPKFIYGQSIGQTLLYTLNAADVGIVAKSLLYSPKMINFKKGKNWIEIDSKLYTPTKQGIVLLKGSSKEAREFYDFMLSKEAKEILKNYGYKVD